MDQTQLAEGRRGGELWQEMIQRQRQERESQDNSVRERLRSLPQEQEKAKEQGLFAPANDNSPVVEASNAAWLDQLREAAQRGGQQQNEMER